MLAEENRELYLRRRMQKGRLGGTQLGGAVEVRRSSLAEDSQATKHMLNKMLHKENQQVERCALFPECEAQLIIMMEAMYD
jgi:hypothetical protein